MDAKMLKKIIKEATKEAFREVLLEQQQINESMKTLNFTSADVNPHLSNDKAGLREQLAAKMGLKNSAPKQNFQPQEGQSLGSSILDDFAKTINPGELHNFRN